MRLKSFDEIKFDKPCFDELVAYITRQSKDDEYFDSEKLDNLLFHCDFGAVRQLMYQITGSCYVKKDDHPVPSDSQTNDILPTDYKFSFSNDVRHVIDDVIEKFSSMTGTEASEYSRGEFGWQYGEEGESISYATALLPRADNPYFSKWIKEREAKKNQIDNSSSVC